MKIVQGGISQSQVLQDVLPGIAFCNLEAEFSKQHDVGTGSRKSYPAPLPPGLSKLFKIAQLIIQYLLHSQRKLTEAITSLQTTNDHLKQVSSMSPRLTTRIHSNFLPDSNVALLFMRASRKV